MFLIYEFSFLLFRYTYLKVFLIDPKDLFVWDFEMSWARLGRVSDVSSEAIIHHRHHPISQCSKNEQILFKNS